MSAFSKGAEKNGHVNLFSRPTSQLVNMATTRIVENAVNSVNIPLGQYRAEPEREGVEVRGGIIPTSPALLKHEEAEDMTRASWQHEEVGNRKPTKEQN